MRTRRSPRNQERLWRMLGGVKRPEPKIRQSKTTTIDLRTGSAECRCPGDLHNARYDCPIVKRYLREEYARLANEQ